MTLIREIGSILLKTVLVTLAVVVGMSLGDLLDLPIWLVGFGCIPAGYLFYRSNGDAPPPLLGLTLLLLLFGLIYPLIPEEWRTLAFICFAMLASYGLNFFKPRTS